MLPSATAIRWGMRLGRWVPAAAMHGGARVAGAIAWRFGSDRRRVIEDNMRHLLTSPVEQRAAARRVLPNLLEATVDLWRLPSCSPEALRTWVAVEGLAGLEEARARGRGVILATAHLGPYELAGGWLAAHGVPVHAMVERMAPETATALAAYRTSTGMQLIDRTSGPRALLQVLRAGEVAALVCDRMVGGGAPGQVVRFGDAWREIPTGPASFARASGAAVVTGMIVRGAAGGARYRLVLDPPVDPSGHTVTSLTAHIGERLAAFVAAHPDQWYNFQPAWRSHAG